MLLIFSGLGVCFSRLNSCFFATFSVSFSAIVLAFLSSKIFGTFFVSSFDINDGFFKIRVVAMSAM